MNSLWIDERGSEVLPLPECLRLLALSAKLGLVGRVAVSRPGAPVIHPVNFRYQDHRIFVRLGEGFLFGAAAGRLVAFEVDQLDPVAGAGWSVLVRGLALPWSQRAEEPAEGPVPAVPVPGEHLIAIRADVVSGRRFALRAGEAGAEEARRTRSGSAEVSSSEVGPGARAQPAPT